MGGSYTPSNDRLAMVESSIGGGGCRCSCQSDLPSDLDSDDPEPAASCCTPQVFTSVLLGILACVLVTGGVFLAFHRWDPMWLLVSGVGVILIFIGSVLHCSSVAPSSPRRHLSGGGKGCRPLPPDHPHHHHHHHPHQMTNNGSLTEQLLPLSNARSVSQLSLNMLPGYFPPVVSAYGIEQHSAVVQNINRIVQQQQGNNGSVSPGAASGNAGKSFILLSLPGDANAANIQNLVATVYQLDGNISSENPPTDVSSQTSSSIVAPTPVSTTTSPVLRNAEVQTCNVWPIVTPGSAPLTSNVDTPTTSTASTSTESCQPETLTSVQDIAVGTASDVAQMEETTSTSASIPVDLIDCNSGLTPVCDSVQNTCDSPPSSDSAVIPEQSSSAPVNVPGQPSNVLIGVPGPSSNVLMDMSGASSIDSSGPSCNILVNITERSGRHEQNESPIADELASHMGIEPHETAPHVEPETSNHNPEIAGPSRINFEPELILAGNMASLDEDFSSSCSNLSAIDAEVDDGEFLGRSSPPPSYEDVTNEGEAAVGAFGLAYGTI